jgi:hypothetical protein
VTRINKLNKLNANKGIEAAVPEEQMHSKFLFQVKDGLTDGGLGDVNPARSLREIQMLGHGSEVTQVTEFHLKQAAYRKQLSVKQ